MSKADISTTPIRSRRAVLTGIAAAAALPIAAALPTAAPAFAASAVPTDPIFAAIDTFRQAHALFFADHVGDIPDQIGDRYSDACSLMRRTRPTTPAGLAVLTTWAREEADWLCANGSYLDGEECRALATTIDDATRGMSGLEPWSPPPAQEGRGSDEPVIAMAQRAVDAWNDYEATARVANSAEDPVMDWRNANPQPVFDSGATRKEQRTANKKWQNRLRSVESKTGYTQAYRAHSRASERFDEVRDDLTDMRPTSIAGLRAKAHAARVSSDEQLQQQIAFDIGVLFGDLDNDERAVQS